MSTVFTAGSDVISAFASFSVAIVVAQRICTSIAQALVAPRSWANLIPAVHSGCSFHSSVVQRTTSISAGSMPARSTASSAAHRPMALVWSPRPGIGLRTSPILVTRISSGMPDSSAISAAVWWVSGT